MEAARAAGWGADSDAAVKLVTFFGVLIAESLPGRLRLRRRPPRAILAARPRIWGEGHAHVGMVELDGGTVWGAEEVIFGLRYRNDGYIAAPPGHDRVEVSFFRCARCRRDQLCVREGGDLLQQLPRF